MRVQLLSRICHVFANPKAKLSPIHQLLCTNHRGCVGSNRGWGAADGHRTLTPEATQVEPRSKQLIGRHLGMPIRASSVIAAAISYSTSSRHFLRAFSMVMTRRQVISLLVVKMSVSTRRYSRGARLDLHKPDGRGRAIAGPVPDSSQQGAHLQSRRPSGQLSKPISD